MQLEEFNARLEAEPILRVALAAHLRLAVRAQIDSWDCLLMIDRMLDEDGTPFSDVLGEMIKVLGSALGDISDVATISDEAANSRAMSWARRRASSGSAQGQGSGRTICTARATTAISRVKPGGALWRE